MIGHARQTLLETPAGRVSPELAKTVADFCEPIDVIKTAYVGLIEITRDFQRPSSISASRSSCPSRSRRPRKATASCALVADRFYDTMPEEILEGGCNFLEPGGIDAWPRRRSRSSPASRGP